MATLTSPALAPPAFPMPPGEVVPGVVPVPSGRVLRSEADLQRRRLPVALLAGMPAFMAAWGLSEGRIPEAQVEALLLAAAIVLLLGVWHSLRDPGSRRGDDPALRRWLQRGNALVGAFFVWLGVATWVAYSGGGLDPLRLGALMTVAVGYIAVAMQLLSVHGRVVIAWILMGAYPLVIRLAFDGDRPFHWQLALVFGGAVFIMAWIARSQRKLFLAMLDLRWREEQMAQQAQRARLEAATAVAERESTGRAKAQFFATASHDLRQPIHALSLFAQALKDRSAGDATTRELVLSIHRSVAALEGLFNALMDISRIDAGSIEVRPQHFRVQDAFDRLQLHFRSMAFDKGLDLRFRGGPHTALADPLLFERVLQNLVSNAIRYSEDGSILVSCRPRGAMLAVQVWDQGMGIAKSDMARIFEEFYRIDSPAAATDAGARKGLGLGLAIVRRLAALMGTRVTVRSVQGQGSVFGFTVPAGTPALIVKPRTVMPATSGVTFDGRRIAVVEDDQAVREALSILLRDWGAEVEAFDSLEAVHAAIDAPVVAARPRPEVIVADYLLPGGRSGLEAIAALREAAGRRLPAVVITGSPLADLEQLAQRQVFHVLSKPVMPARLRAVLAHKLGSGRRP